MQLEEVFGALWRLRYHLNLRNLVEMFLERGMTIPHETLHQW